MGNDSGFGYSDILEKMDENRKIEQAEREIRYAGRKKEKVKQREAVERAAEKLCAAIELALNEEHSPSDLAALSAALGGAASAMHAAENYAEFMPIYGSEIGYCAV